MENNHDYDTLDIKKDTRRDIIYHYKKKSFSRENEPEKLTGFKRLIKNKALLIIVCDILLIVVIFVLIRSPLFNGNKRHIVLKKIDNYMLTFSSYRIKDKVFARVKVEKTKENSTSSEEIIKVSFFIDDEHVHTQSHLPQTEGEPVEMRATLMCEDTEKELSAFIRIGDISETLVMIPEER